MRFLRRRFGPLKGSGKGSDRGKESETYAHTFAVSLNPNLQTSPVIFDAWKSLQSMISRFFIKEMPS